MNLSENTNRPLSILLIADFPFLPANEGNKRRLLDVINFYQSLGWRVNFFLIGKDKSSYRKMERLVNGKCFFYAAPLLTKLSFVLQRIRAAIGWMLHIDFLRDYSVHCYFPNNLASTIRNVVEENKIDAIQVEYLYLSNLLNNSKDKYLIVDTHDVMGNRWRKFRERGLLTTWYSINEDDEKRALADVDCTLSISGGDFSHFKNIYGLNNVKLLDFIYPVNPIWKSTSSRVLFVGSNNRMNRSGLKWFVDRVLPLVVSEFPDFKITVVGSVGESFSELNNVESLGFVDNLEDIYMDTLLVVNPVFVGTGLPIKTLEALAYGIPVLSREAGMRGSEFFRDSGIQVHESHVEFSEFIIESIKHPERLISVSNSLVNRFQSMREQCVKASEQIAIEINSKKKLSYA